MPAGSVGDGAAVPEIADARMLTLRMDQVNTASRTARQYLRSQLTDVDQATLETVLLVASEMVTNAVLHATGPIDLTVNVGTDRIGVAVFDCEPLPPQVRDHDIDRTNGRGMALISMISAEWGTRYHDDGKTVWSVIDRE